MGADLVDVEQAGFLEEPDEGVGAGAFVAVYEDVGFDDEIQQVGGFFFDCGIDVFSGKRLEDIAKQGV